MRIKFDVVGYWFGINKGTPLSNLYCAVNMVEPRTLDNPDYGTLFQFHDSFFRISFA